MQTFLPIPSTDFSLSAKVLDNKRLNKQALEAWQILMNLLELDPAGNYRKPKGWSNHPAVKMWKGNEAALLSYILDMVEEWKRRGYNSTIGEKALKTVYHSNSSLIKEILFKTALPEYPDWMTNTAQFETIAKTHREALLVKNYDWYKSFLWIEGLQGQPTDYTYIWPV